MVRAIILVEKHETHEMEQKARFISFPAIHINNKQDLKLKLEVIFLNFCLSLSIGFKVNKL